MGALAALLGTYIEIRRAGWWIGYRKDRDLCEYFSGCLESGLQSLYVQGRRAARCALPRRPWERGKTFSFHNDSVACSASVRLLWFNRSNLQLGPKSTKANVNGRASLKD